MYFQIFRLFTTIVREINFSIDFVQHDRFHAQIRQLRRQRVAHKVSPAMGNKVEKIEEKLNPQVPVEGNRDRNLWRDIQWMLEYNQYTYLMLFINLFHLFFISHIAIRSSIYATFPSQKDPKTQLYVNPVLRYMDSIWMHDLARNFEQSTMFNRLITLYCIQFSLLRFRAFYARLRTACINRHGYKQLNMIQLHMSAAHEFIISPSLIMWYIKSYNHECDFNSLNHRRRHMAMKKLTRELRKASKIERYYFYNQIEFNGCFVGIVNRIPHDREEVEKISPSETTGYWARLKQLLALKRPGYRCFVAEPFMRLDRQHVLVSGVVYLCAVLGLICVLFMAIVMSLLPELERIGLDLADLSGTIGPTLSEFLNRPKLQHYFLEVMIFLSMIAVNAFDNGLLVFSSAVCLSRANSVCKLLKRQVSKYREHLTELADQIERKRSEALADDLIAAGINRTFKETSKRFKSKSPSELDQLTEEQHRLIESQDQRSFEQALIDYRLTISPVEAYTFNDELDYILDLIGVLELEFSDSRKFFTFYIDMNIIFGSICSAVVTTVITGITRWQNSIIWCCGTVVCVVPLVVSLALGASSESSFRSIYKHLTPLMGNELSLLNPRIMHRIHRFNDHMIGIENRSFLVLRNFPLTFGSMTSILGWIATGNLVLQRFLD